MKLRPDRDTVLRLVRENFGPDLQKAVTFTVWKDGIDVDYTTFAIEAFADAVFALGRQDAMAEIDAMYTLSPRT